MPTFVKTTTCPMTGALSAYASGRLAPADRTPISLHLSACDFCGAALHMLAARPRADEDLPPEAPPPLLVLLLAGLLPAPSKQSEPARLLRAA